jgi:hypothetical protein
MHELFDSMRMLCTTLETGDRLALWRALCAAVDPCLDQFSRGLLASRGGLAAGFDGDMRTSPPNTNLQGFPGPPTLEHSPAGDVILHR